jgi:hypothetical protein
MVYVIKDKLPYIDWFVSNKMVHPEGFEPPTKWFEATYSIQLSYGCVTAGRQFNVSVSNI